VSGLAVDCWTVESLQNNYFYPVLVLDWSCRVCTAVDARKCYATGRGIQPKGVRVGDDAVFKVHTQGAGEGDLNVKVLKLIRHSAAR